MVFVAALHRDGERRKREAPLEHRELVGGHAALRGVEQDRALGVDLEVRDRRRRTVSTVTPANTSAQ